MLSVSCIRCSSLTFIPCSAFARKAAINAIGRKSWAPEILGVLFERRPASETYSALQVVARCARPCCLGNVLSCRLSLGKTKIVLRRHAPSVVISILVSFCCRFLDAFRRSRPAKSSREVSKCGRFWHLILAFLTCLNVQSEIPASSFTCWLESSRARASRLQCGRISRSRYDAHRSRVESS